MNHKNAQIPGKKSKNDLRNSRIMEMAASGMSQSEIGEDVGLRREAINRILNSDEAKKLTEQSRSGIHFLLDDAVVTLKAALANRHQDMRSAITAATTILKGLGVLTEKAEVPIMRPMVIQLTDGSEIHLGHRQEAEGNESCPK